MLNESLSKKVNANTSTDNNLYIKQMKECSLTNAGFKFGIPYIDDEVPGCGIGNIYGGISIYLSIGMTHKYDASTGTSNWINTVWHPRVDLNISPKAILLAARKVTLCGTEYEPGVYILSATQAVRELKAIIPDSEITVTKIG